MELGANSAVYKNAGATLDALLQMRCDAGEPLPAYTDGAYVKLALTWEDLGYSAQDTLEMLMLLEASCASVVANQLPAHCASLFVRAIFAPVICTVSNNKVVEMQVEMEQRHQEEDFREQLTGRFLSNAAHDLRTPLTAITGFSELLLEGDYGALTDDQMEKLGHISDSGQNLLEQINNMLDALQIQRGNLTLNRKRVSAVDVVTDSFRLLQALAARRLVEFTLELPPAMGSVVVDEKLVRHMIYQLGTSSLRASPTHGAVSLSAEKVGDGLIIYLRDNALRLPPEVLSGMHGSVSTLENVPIRGMDGWELGISLVKKYVSLHGGTLRASNLEPTGTEFRIELPAPHN